MGFLDPNSWSQAFSDDPTGSKYAADTSSQASAAQLQLQKQMWDYQRSLMDRYVQGGGVNYDRLMQEAAPGGYFDRWTMDKYKQSVPYQAMMDPENIKRMNQGVQAQAAASGMFGSPAVANAIAANMQNNALQAQGQGYSQWTDDYNRLAGRGGMNAAQQVGNLASNYATGAGNIVGQNAMNQANAAMAGAQNPGMAALGQSAAGIGNSLLNRWMNSWGKPSGGGYDPFSSIPQGYDPYNQVGTDAFMEYGELIA